MIIKKSYTFKNGWRVDFTYNGKNHNMRAEWTPDLFESVYKEIKKEYYSECIPNIYQDIANEIGEPIVYADPSAGIVIKFKPIDDSNTIY